MAEAIEKAIEGFNVNKHLVDQLVTFMLDNTEEVKLRVKQIEILAQDDQISSLRIYAQANFKNVLKLAKKLNMKMSAFNKTFTVILNALPELLEIAKPHLQNMTHVSVFFEAMDGETKHPIFFNLNQYKIERISQ